LLMQRLGFPNQSSEHALHSALPLLVVVRGGWRQVTVIAVVAAQFASRAFQPFDECLQHVAAIERGA